MLHENDEVLKMVRAMCKKTIKLHDHYQETEDCVRTFELDDLAYLVRLLTAELGEEYGGGD